MQKFDGVAKRGSIKECDMEAPAITKEILWWFSNEYNTFGVKNAHVAAILLGHYREDKPFLDMMMRVLFGDWSTTNAKRTILRGCIHRGLLDVFLYLMELMEYSPKSMWSFFKTAMENKVFDIAEYIHKQYPDYATKYMTEILTKQRFCPQEETLQFCIDNKITIPILQETVVINGERQATDMYHRITKTIEVSDHIPYLISYSYFHNPDVILKLYPNVDLEVMSQLILLGNSSLSIHEEFTKLCPKYKVSSKTVTNLIMMLCSLNPTGYCSFHNKVSSLLRTVQMTPVNIVTILKTAMDMFSFRYTLLSRSILKTLPMLFIDLSHEHEVIEYLYDYAVSKKAYPFAWFFAVELFTFCANPDALQVFSYDMSGLHGTDSYRKLTFLVTETIDDITRYGMQTNSRMYIDWARLNRTLFSSMDVLRVVRNTF